MRKVYIVLTYTGTVLSNIIRQYTKDEFSHVSVSLNEELTDMYSFGRYNPYNAFIGGFVKECIGKGVYKRFKNTKACVYSLEITDEQYIKMKDIIKGMLEEKDKYRFNFIGLLAVSINKKYTTAYSFYCAEFVKYLIEESGVKTNLPRIVRPEDFKKEKNLKEIYYGLLKEYTLKKEEDCKRSNMR